MCLRIVMRSFFLLRYFYCLVALLIAFYDIAAQDKVSEQPVAITANTFRMSPEAIKNEAGELVVYAKTNPDSALERAQQLLIASKEIGFNKGIYFCNLICGAVYAERGEYKTAMAYYQQSLAVAVKTPDPMLDISQSLINIGNLHVFQASYADAVDCYTKAAFLAEKFSSKDTVKNLLVRIYVNLSAPLTQINEYDKALYYLKRAERLAIKHHYEDLISGIYINQSAIYADLKKGDSAILALQKALKIAIETKNNTEIGLAYRGIGDVYLDVYNDPSKAIYYLQKSLAADASRNPYYTLGVPYSLGSAYLEIKDYTLAEKYLRITLKEAQRTNNKDYILYAHELLAKLYAATNHYQYAYNHHAQAYDMRDSVLGKEQTSKANKLETEYRTAQKDIELAQKQLLISRQQRMIDRKNIVIICIASGSLIALILLVVVYRNHKHKQKLQANQIRILRQEKEIDNLRAVMSGEEKERIRIARELHDGIGGTLAAVKMNFALVQKTFDFLEGNGDYRNAMARLDSMSHELRQAAHNLMPERIIQHGLSESVSLYCTEISKGKNMEIEYQSIGNFDMLPDNLVISIYRIVQELLHNIIRHSFATHVIVQLSRHNHSINITVEDDGIGFDINRIQHGFGLKNIRSRVESLNGHITIESGINSGTAVYLDFDVEQAILMHQA